MSIRPKKLDLFKTLPTFPTPDERLVGLRMAELRVVGLEDLPQYEGISSSVRQYAWATLAIERDRNEEKKICFATCDEPLLSRSEQLAERYGVTPIHPMGIQFAAMRDRMLSRLDRDRGGQADSQNT
jgi:hypothetical protein